MINIHSGADSVELVLDWNSNIHSLPPFIIYDIASVLSAAEKQPIYDDIHTPIVKYFEFHLIPFVRFKK